ncbi:arginine biosynthesis protein ArgJ [Fistulina hepatica ATCC 64428]|uniref:Arginine biosynthesis bifunctional protein ArgJ, mitochondrial n=1 Tax=Fistulina hepatica ATCC 64428 TaxID=1128425 RepID=A0A0D7AN89_9AGAR|nr:arginine biosynthesis protein ArgJ [Fistulina hepatica ATCC 64428]
MSFPCLVFRRFSSTVAMKTGPSKQHFALPISEASLPKGFVATGLHCGVKKDATANDLAIIISESPRETSAAGCFTKNAFQAAPVCVSQEILRRTNGRARSLVVNSGCANAVTGEQGLQDAWAMSQETSHLYGAQEPSALVMSTGVIGQKLPISKIVTAIKSQARSAATRSLSPSASAWQEAAKAFMTTDTFPKIRARTFSIGGADYRIAGIDKGAGMIHPIMGPPVANRPLHATLLGCILTDAPVTPSSLQSALTHAVDRSFNCISVDGDMSTNDTIVALANGAAAPDDIPEIDEETAPDAFLAFRTELTNFAIDLAKLVVRDGEGATKFVTVTVKNAATYEDAHRIASKVSTSALVKTALYGEDANWGRILSSSGSVQGLSVPINPARVSVSFIPSDGTAALPVLVNGEPKIVDEVRAKEILELDDFEVCIDIGDFGSQQAKYWTCDLSYEYVRINGDYRS